MHPECARNAAAHEAAREFEHAGCLRARPQSSDALEAIRFSVEAASVRRDRRDRCRMAAEGGRMPGIRLAMSAAPKASEAARCTALARSAGVSPSVPRQSQQHQPPTPESIRAFHQAAQPGLESGTDGRTRSNRQAHNSRVKADRVRGATSSRPPASRIRTTAFSSSFTTLATRAFGSGTRNVINLVDEDHCVFQRSNSSKALCSSSPSSQALRPRASTEDLHKRQPNRPATALRMTSCQYRRAEEQHRGRGHNAKPLGEVRFEQRCEDPLVDDLSLRSQPGEFVPPFGRYAHRPIGGHTSLTVRSLRLLVERDADCFKSSLRKAERPGAAVAINAVTLRAPRPNNCDSAYSIRLAPIRRSLHPEPQRWPRCGRLTFEAADQPDDIVLDGRNDREVVGSDRPPHQRGRDGGLFATRLEQADPEEGHRVTRHAATDRGRSQVGGFMLEC